ncbi:MAG: hypothetical protein NTX64_15180 [Elusimicrobia bacterium]|nr:hypothetical protein [Elusimicrobiota bacterium]
MRLSPFLFVLALSAVCRAEEPLTVERAAADIPAVLRQAKKDAAAQPYSTQALAWGGFQTTMDCKKFVFDVDTPAESKEQDLRSETWLEECMPGSGPICFPRRTLMRADVRTVKILIPERQAPGPKEVFEVCLFGGSLSFDVKQSPNKYKAEAKEEPVLRVTYVLTKK